RLLTLAPAAFKLRGRYDTPVRRDCLAHGAGLHSPDVAAIGGRGIAPAVMLARLPTCGLRYDAAKSSSAAMLCSATRPLWVGAGPRRRQHIFVRVCGESSMPHTRRRYSVLASRRRYLGWSIG